MATMLVMVETAIWASYGTTISVFVREIRLGEWSQWDERGREKREFYRSSNHEKCEGEIVGENAGEISEDNQEGGEIIWG